MIRFISHLALGAIALLISGGLLSAQTPITYTLPKDGKVSLAVYDAQGRMVRTLRNAEPQKAGAQTVQWDGLDLNGKPVPADDYTWKLLLSQGMKAEYLLSLGTSVGVSAWTSQHGGPYVVEVLEDGDIISGGNPEGSPMLARLHPTESKVLWTAGNRDGWEGVHEAAEMNGIVYGLMNNGMLRLFDARTGGMPSGKTDFALLLPVADLGPVPSGKESRTFEFPVKRGDAKIRAKITTESAGGTFALTSGEKQWPIIGLKPGQELTTSFKGVEGIIDASKSGKFTIKVEGLMDDWSASSVEVVALASRVAAGDGVILGAFPAGDRIGWFSEDGKVLASAEVPNPGDVAVVDAQTALVTSGNELLEVKRDGTRRVLTTELASPKALSFDRNSGQIFVAETGKSNQVKRFSREGKLEATFGRAGGRKTGAYVAEDFLGGSNIAADGKGGFWITESESAPRRTAHFDADGKLLGEWYGGQQFYTFAAPDPEDPNILWMDSQWGWLMQVKVDWDKRDWKVVGTYQWGGGLPGSLVSLFKMAAPHQVRSFDLNGDGQKERYIVSRSNTGFLMRVDEAAGVLQPIAYTGRILPNRGWGWSNAPLKEIPPAYLEAVHRIDPNIKETLDLRKFLGFSWADADGNGKMEADEFDPTPGERLFGAGPLLWLGDDLTIHFPSGEGKKSIPPAWLELPASGRTATGAPIWDWKKERPGSINLPAIGDKVMSLLPDSDGNWLAIVHSDGDAFTSEVMGMGHGFGWPANQAAQVSVMKWNRAGELLWRVGQLSSNRTNRPGQLHYPVHFAGKVNGTIGVCDKVVQPVVFWTEDGLYAGGLFDRRADDGLPKRVYSWWTDGSDDFNPETGRALFQYDMALGGSLIQRPNGDVIFIGSGWNNCPAFRVTGWDEMEHQTGKVKVSAPAAAVVGKGTGLKGDFFPNTDWKGAPGFTMVSPQIWFEPKRAKAQIARPELNWANPQLKTGGVSLDEVVLASDELELDAPVRPVMDGPFSARWTGYVEPRFSEDYTFSVYQKSGLVRLSVDGKPVAETAKDAKAYSRPIPLQAGHKVAIQLEWSGPPDGDLHFNWQSLSQPIEHVPVTSLYPEKP